MRKWTVILAAIVFTMSLAATGFAFGPDIEANGNDLVGATSGGTAANDSGQATNDSYNTDTDTKNVTVTKTDTDTKTATDSFNDTTNKTVTVTKTDTDTKTATDSFNDTTNKTVTVNKTDTDTKTATDSFNDGKANAEKGSAAANVTNGGTANAIGEQNNDNHVPGEKVVNIDESVDESYTDTSTYSYNDTSTKTNQAGVAGNGAAANNGSKAEVEGKADGSRGGNAANVTNGGTANAIGEQNNDNHVPGEKVVNIDESVDESYTDTSTYSDTSTYNKQEAEAKGKGNAAVIGDTATVDQSDNSTNNKAEEGGVIATDTGTATLDKSFNLTIGDINTAMSSTELNSTVSGNKIGSEAEVEGGSGSPFDQGRWGSKDGGGESRSSISIDTGNNRIENYTQTGIGSVIQNSGVQSSVQGGINVNANVGSIQ